MSLHGGFLLIEEVLLLGVLLELHLFACCLYCAKLWQILVQVFGVMLVAHSTHLNVLIFDVIIFDLFDDFLSLFELFDWLVVSVVGTGDLFLGVSWALGFLAVLWEGVLHVES